MSLHALISEMRERAALQPYNDMALLAIRWADALEAWLAGGGEAVAWVDRFDVEALASGKCSRTDVFANKHDGDDVPLYLHPAGAVQVTDEMVELAEDFFYDNSPFNGQDELREGLRGCLNAALTPGGSRE